MPLMIALVVVVAICFLLLWLKARKEATTHKARSDAAEERGAQLSAKVTALELERDALSKYSQIKDAEEFAQGLRAEAQQALDQARLRAKEDLLNAQLARQEADRECQRQLAAARAQADELIDQAKLQAADQLRRAKQASQEAEAKCELQLKQAGQAAEKIINEAKSRAETIAGDAYEAMNRSKEYQATASAIKNIIDGYGDRYLVPTYSLLDELAEDFGFTEAGQQLKAARSTTRSMLLANRAATCEYVEPQRRATAIRFVTDAFNGKVDSILSRSKADNHGKLAQEIRDAYAVVNHNGTAFRNAKITEDFLNARLDELKWAATAHALRDKERDEQRALREAMREEERARKEYERAIKDAAKEEETLRKAMEKAQKLVAEANDAQRADLEAKLRDLEEKLKQAEERNQRALSMAQQTRTGHVYVISNIGSFGEHVFKIGMTRRLEPKDRIRELGDASVPFEFDVHAMIFSEDAPSLEKALHKHFVKQQVNKMNPRKEFFKVDLPSIRRELDDLGIQAHWTMTAEALEYRATLQIERQMSENPEVAEAWSERQLAYENHVQPEMQE